MARFDTSGFDDIIELVTAMGEEGEAVGKRMLVAGAEEVRKAWKAAAEKHGLRDTGAMIASIGYANEPSDVGGIRFIDIYPRGKDKKGVRNAEKAFILHYGTSSAASLKKRSKTSFRAFMSGKKYKGAGIPATHWVDDADKLSAEPVQTAFETIWDEFLKGGDGSGT